MTGLRLVPPIRPELPPELSAEQRGILAALDAPGAGHVVVMGEPGSGKSTVAVHAYVHAVAQGSGDPRRVVMLTPTRSSAVRLRDVVALAADQAMEQPQVRTPASLAYAILAADAAQRGDPLPQLITGADQDAVLKSLLDGHRRGMGRQPRWDGIVPPEATALAGFRSELRDLLMRAAEAGATPADLAEWGQRCDRPEWTAAAQVYQEYRDVLALRSGPGDQGERLDPAAMVANAAVVLDTWSSHHRVKPPEVDLIIIDDAHDLTAAGVALARAYVGWGARVLALGNADQAVQGFRGSVPQALADIAQGSLGSAPVTRFELTEQHRWSGAVATVARHVRDRIGVTTIASARQQVGSRGGADGEASVMVASQGYAQARGIARYLRQRRHADPDRPVPWSQMAVIARSRSQLRELRQQLAACDIPCAALTEATAVHEEPAVAPLLLAMEVALRETLEPERADELLMSRLGGLDAVGVRTLRRALVRRDRAEGGHEAADQLLTDLIMSDGPWEGLPADEVSEARLSARAIAAATAAVKEPAATAGSVLWAAWEAWGRAETMRQRALEGSVRDDADLDAVVAVFKAAQTFSEKLPSAGPEEFLDYVLSQELAMDTLGQRGRIDDVVEFCTPVTSAGREWDVVVVAGVDHGLWPNTSLRDTVLGAGHLVEVAAGLSPAAPLSDADRTERLARSRQSVLHDETRALYVAVSRAREHVLVCGVSDMDHPPSRFIESVRGAPGVSELRPDSSEFVADERDAVARLRHALATTGSPAAAQGLATLARMGVTAAHPDQWHGALEWSTDQPVWQADQVVPVSPSRVDAVERCELQAALTAAGGTTPSDARQGLGTLIHQIAAEFPQGGLAAMERELDSRWPELGLGESLSARRQRERAREMLVRWDDYASSVAAERVMVEHPVDVVEGRARLVGRADRVEITGEAARIVDIKTGALASRADAESQGQLAMYQLAVLDGAIPGVTQTDGAALVHVAPHQRSAAVRTQSPIDPVEQRARLASVVDAMSGPQFVAQPGTYCSSCPVRRSCPAQPSGQQVSDR